MNSPLRLFRELLPFRPPPDERQAAADLHERLLGLAGQPAEHAVLALYKEIVPAILQQSNLQTRFKLLEDTHRAAEQALPALEARVGDSPLPLPRPVARLALLADNLMKVLASAYHDIVRQLCEQQRDAALGQLFHRAILRAMGLLARRQHLASRAYARASPSTWLLLHELYRLACSPTARPLTAETAPVEHQYLSALLFAYLQPNRLPRGELDAAIRCAETLAAYALISELHGDALNGPTREFRYVVQPGEGHPGLPLQRLPAGAAVRDALLIDCAPVVMTLERNLARRSDPARRPDLDASPALLQTLHDALDGKHTRRYRRSRARPRGELASGLDAVLDFIAGQAVSRRSVDALSRNDRRFASSEWSLIDESPDGFRIRYQKGEHGRIGVGQIVALQPRDASRVHVCLVRRVTNADGRFELGLQVLSPQVSIVHLPGRDAPPLRALFLHKLPAYGGLPGIVAPAQQLARGQAIELAVAGRRLQKTIGPCIEAGEGLEFFALDPLPD